LIGHPPGVLAGFELAGRQVAEGLVQAGGVEPADVFDDGQLELGATPPDAV